MSSNLIIDNLHRLHRLSLHENAQIDRYQLRRLFTIALAKLKPTRLPAARDQKVILIVLSVVSKFKASAITLEINDFVEQVCKNIELVYHTASDTHECDFIAEVFSGLISNHALSDTCFKCMSNIRFRNDHAVLESRLVWLCRKTAASVELLNDIDYNFLGPEVVFRDAIEFLRWSYACDMLIIFAAMLIQANLTTTLSAKALLVIVLILLDV